MKRYSIILLTGILVIIILSVIQISVSNMLSTGGLRLSQLEEQVSDYKRQNAMLKEQIYATASLTAIADKAGKEGFTPSTQKTAVVITDHTSSVALRQ